jgi:hypothetical protein
VAVLVAVAARADYRRSYVDAQRAERAGRLAEAAAGYEAAGREHPQEAARARLVGAIPEPYLPFHRLGVVLHELHRCRVSLDAFERSARQGVAARLESAAAEAEPRRRECERQLAAEEAEGKGRLEPGSTLPAPPSGTESGTAAGSAPAEKATAPVTSGTELDLSAAAPAPAPRAPAGVGAVSAAQALPPNLRAAAEAYFAGSYATAVDLATRQLPSTQPGSPAEFIARLLRGAGRYALYLLEGERDGAALLAATEDLRVTHRLRPGFRPRRTEFSPRFVSFYERIAAEPGGPAAR